MYVRDQLRPLTVTLIVFLQQFARLLVKRRVRIRINKQALDSDEDVPDAIRLLPVLFEGIYSPTPETFGWNILVNQPANVV